MLWLLKHTHYYAKGHILQGLMVKTIKILKDVQHLHTLPKSHKHVLFDMEKKAKMAQEDGDGDDDDDDATF